MGWCGRGAGTFGGGAVVECGGAATERGGAGAGASERGGSATLIGVSGGATDVLVTGAAIECGARAFGGAAPMSAIATIGSHAARVQNPVFLVA
jgi:hypothetical protein